MNIAFVTINGRAWGGSEVLWTAAAKESLKQGHKVLVSMFDFPDLPQPIQELKDNGAAFHFRRRFYPPLLKRLNKKISNSFAGEGKKKTYHDYLNSFGADTILFNLGGGEEMASDPHDLMVFVKQTNIPFSIYCHSLSLVPVNNEQVNENLRVSFSKAKHVFFTSNMQKETYEHQIQMKIANGVVMSQPLNVDTIAAVDVHDTGYYEMAMIGNMLLRHKGQDVAIKALSGEKWRSRNFRLNIYGIGEDEQYVRKYVAYYGLQDKVVFHGFEKDMTNIWKNNHIHIIPSRQDSGPITLFEAMCCGKPIVGTRMGAIAGYVEDNVNGYICEPGSVVSFEEALDKAWSRKEEWSEMGKESMRIMKEKYDFNPANTILKYLVA